MGMDIGEEDQKCGAWASFGELLGPVGLLTVGDCGAVTNPEDECMAGEPENEDVRI